MNTISGKLNAIRGLMVNNEDSIPSEVILSVLALVNELEYMTAGADAPAKHMVPYKMDTEFEEKMRAKYKAVHKDKEPTEKELADFITDPKTDLS